MTTTIRKNSIKKIEALVAACALRSRYQDDGMDSRNTALTTAEVMALAPRFEHVYLRDNGCLSIGICGHVDFISCYPTVEIARKLLTDVAFARHFPNAA